MLVRNGTCMKCNTCGASYLSTGTPRDCYEVQQCAAPGIVRPLQVCPRYRAKLVP